MAKYVKNLSKVFLNAFSHIHSYISGTNVDINLFFFVISKGSVGEGNCGIVVSMKNLVFL